MDIQESTALAAAAKIQAKAPEGVKVVAAKADVSKEDEIKGVVERAVKEFGRLDIMVSCACIHLNYVKLTNGDYL